MLDQLLFSLKSEMVGFVLHIIMYVLPEERNAEETSVPVLRPASRSSCTCGVLLIKMDFLL